MRKVTAALLARPKLSAREIAATVGVSRTEINQVLYKRPDLFRREGDAPPRWTCALTDLLDALSEEATAQPASPSTSYALDLHAWQSEAMDAWEENGRRGIVEAVTGAGKTRLGLVAVHQTLEEGGRAAVIVPTIELLRQWQRQLEDLLGTPVGVLGDGEAASLARYRVIVATVHSAAKSSLGLPAGTPGLLVADEVHRFAGDIHQGALKEAFDERLGLSATYERQDGKHEEVLLPYFDDVVYTLDYERASADDVIAPVRLAFYGVDMEDEEQAEYDRLSEIVSKRYGSLVNNYGAPSEPWSAFMSFVNALANQSENGGASIAAGSFLSAIGKRRKLLAETPAKLAALENLVDAIETANGTIVFTTTIESVERIVAELNAHGVVARPHHSKVDHDERAQTLQDFSARRIEAVVTAKTLNEGVDVPEADLGVIFGGSRQRREMVQRMGRVLRKKPDGREARFVVLYVVGSAEDPDQGFQEAFIEEMAAIAEATEDFFGEVDPDEITGFLDPEG